MEAAHAPRLALWPGTAAALHGTPHAGGLPARAIRAWVRPASWPSGQTDQTAGIASRYLHALQTAAEPNGFLRHPSGQRGHGGKLIRIARHVLPGALAPRSAQASKRWPKAATWWSTMRAVLETVGVSPAQARSQSQPGRLARPRGHLQHAHTAFEKVKIREPLHRAGSTVVGELAPVDHCATPVVLDAQSTHTPRTATSMVSPL